MASSRLQEHRPWATIFSSLIMNNKKVSIIIPFYNTNIQYYQKCQDSISCQSYQNLEIIVVDDGSKNVFAAQLDEVVKQDERTRVIHKQNGGVSSARNQGLKEATGEYIAFVDSDDWVEPTFIETLVRTMEVNNAQISVVGVIEEYNDVEMQVDNTYAEFKILPRQDMYAALVGYSTNIRGYLCNKLFYKELIAQTLNENYHYCEDFVFNAHYMKQVQIGATSSARLYHYRMGQGNATSNCNYNSKIFTLIDAYREAETIFQIECPQKLAFIRNAILKQALNIRARYKISRANDIEQYNYLQWIIEAYWDAYKIAPVIEKINIRLTRTFPVLLFKTKRFILSIKN